MAPVSPVTTQTRTEKPFLDVEGIRAFFRKLLSFLSYLVALFVLGLVIVGLYYTLDEKGWITHSRNVGTYIDGNWMVGEIRNCGLSGNAAALSCQADPYSISEVSSWSRNTHIFPVSFHGRIDLPQGTTWRCQRKEDSLNCD